MCDTLVKIGRFAGLFLGVNVGTKKSKVITARFPNADLRLLQEASMTLGVTKNELILAGALAEVERRLKIQRGEATKELAPVFAN